jgi:hypothetical protein
MRARHQVVGDKLASQAAQAQGARLELQQMIASSKQELKALLESGFHMSHPAYKVSLAAHCQPWDAREHWAFTRLCCLQSNPVGHSSSSLQLSAAAVEVCLASCACPAWCFARTAFCVVP